MKIKADLIHRPERLRPAWCQVEKVVELSGPDFDAFLIAPQEEQPFLADNAELMHEWDGVNYCLLALRKDHIDGILIQCGDDGYARYTAYVAGARDIVQAKGSGLDAMLKDALERRREDHAALLDAKVAEICTSSEGLEIVLTDVAPEELARFNDAYEAFMDAEQAMGPAM